MPGYGIPALSGSFKTYDADLINKQFRAVKFTSAGVVDFCTAATDLSIGIQNSVPAAAANRDVEVIMLGESKAKLGGTVAAGQFLVPDANGDLVAVTLGVTTTNVAVARALDAGVDNDIIRVMVNPQFIQV